MHDEVTYFCSRCKTYLKLTKQQAQMGSYEMIEHIVYKREYIGCDKCLKAMIPLPNEVQLSPKPTTKESE